MLPATSPAQRAPHYKDLLQILIYGFLSHRVSLGGRTLALRSLGAGDLFILNHRTMESGAEWETWALAQSLWMVDGEIVSEADRGALREFVQELPRSIYDGLMGLLLSFFHRVQKAFTAIEPFSYEGHSRRLWQTKGTRIALAGVQPHDLDTDVYGLWAYHNVARDLSEKQSSQMQLFLGPHLDKKAWSKIRSREEREVGRVQLLHDRWYYKTTLGVDAFPDTFLAGQGLALKSLEELEAEMARWVRGEDDDHDRVVRAYKDMIRASCEAREAAERAQYEQPMMEEDEDAPVFTAHTGPLVEMPHTRSVSGEFQAQARALQAQVLERIRAGESPGVLSAVGGKVIAPSQ